MTILELAAAVVVASYAMIGGVFFSAAITSPKNCGTILAKVYPRVIVLCLGLALSFVLFVLIAFLIPSEDAGYMVAPMMVIFMAHWVLLLIYFLCWRIVEELLRSEQQEEETQE